MYDNKVYWNEGLNRYMRKYAQNTRWRNCGKALRRFNTRVIMSNKNIVKRKYKYCSNYKYILKGEVYSE